ncbi:transcription initiation protein SPT3 homolog [Chelonus insularis]|uniref:transcription initiation protein SPT3 homolog n=1 Tax=Chelonus insularis TaxID=460826 RepID=UPI00158EC2EE|nr:transcription initiation protein SPT3 homolog [Chelonus insularis]XP_034937776.1 transcription initiation protein SPT3 homolog [Chelonus insularis]
MTESTASSINANVKSESVNYIPEVRRMMYGFGDCSEPLIESAKIINSVVQRQMKSIVYEASKIADMRDSQIVEERDFLFLLRRDKTQLQRLLKYLDLKDFKSSINKVLDSELNDDLLDDTQNNAKKKSSHRKFIESIDTIGVLTDSENHIDYVKRNREIRAELASRKMDSLQYLEYSKARAASFANKYNHKFESWIATDNDIKISKSSYTILGYLAFETVAQIMDLAFLVRQDQSKIHGDSLDRLRFSFYNPYTYKPHQYGKGTSVKPITPAEINEALRRFWSPQLDTMGPFQRRSIHRQDCKFLAFETT